MKIKFVLFLSFSLLILSKATSQTIKSGEDWIYVSIDEEGNKTYIRNRCIASDDQYIKLWTKKESKKEIINKKTFLNVKTLTLVQYDCVNRRARVFSMIDYNSKGKVISSVNIKEYEAEWFDIAPESIGEATINKVCLLYR